MKSSQCVRAWGEKVKYPTKLQARMSAHVRRKQTGIRFDAYKCSECGYWHYGREPVSKEMWHIRKSYNNHENMLVGKLIVAIRGVIEK